MSELFLEGLVGGEAVLYERAGMEDGGVIALQTASYLRGRHVGELLREIHGDLTGMHDFLLATG